MYVGHVARRLHTHVNLGLLRIGLCLHGGLSSSDFRGVRWTVFHVIVVTMPTEGMTLDKSVMNLYVIIFACNLLQY